MSISKSLITNNTRSGLSRSLLNPVNDTLKTIAGSSGALEVLNRAYLSVLERIKKDYGRHMTTKTYECRSQKHKK